MPTAQTVRVRYAGVSDVGFVARLVEVPSSEESFEKDALVGLDRRPLGEVESFCRGDKAPGLDKKPE